MDSTNALPADRQTLNEERPPWSLVGQALRHALIGMALRRDDDRPGRAMRLDPWRLLLTAVVAAVLAAVSAGLWTWHQHQRHAELSAQLALAFLDRRLSAIDLEMAQLSRRVDPTAALSACPDELVAMLLQQSLQSSLVRRFDLVQVGSPLRCEPGGARQGPPLEALPPAGLSIVPGSARSTRPVVQRPHGAVIAMQATLDPFALTLPTTALPDDLNSLPMRIEVHSPPAGVLLIRDTRPHPGRSEPALNASVWSTSDNIGVQVQIDRSDLTAGILQPVLGAVAGTLLLLVATVAAVWRRALTRARLLHRLRRALRKRQFEPFVQPIIDLQSGRCVGAEVLMRWSHPQRGILAPIEFIDEAERTGLIVPMSELVMTRAAHRLAPLAQMHPELYFSFNVTPSQLRQPGFVRQLDETFRSDTLPRERVLLELTEREFVDGDTQRALAVLHARGWRMAVDDFGTGHSSLASLESLAIDRIKIDRAFVRTIDDQTVDRPVLDAIIGLATQLKVPLIAEGVETQAQWDYLAARGVRHAQGFLMARPMAIDAFVTWLAEPGQPHAQTPALAAPSVGDASLRALWQQLAMPGGVDQRDRIFRLHTYRHCFIGREAVDWIAQQLRVSRAVAVRLGQRLVALDLVRHVVDEHDFEDAEFFYRIVHASAQAVESAPASQDLRQALKGEAGVALRDHARGLIVQCASARGRDIVDWTVARYDVSRSTACQWAAQLMRVGALRHVYDDRPFSDDTQLFRPV